MIDIANETVLSISDATTHLPRRRKGRKPHASTLFRWASRGMRGVVLETIQIGGTKCTSLEALQRFFDRLSGHVAAPVITTTASRTRRMHQAVRSLKRAGFDVQSDSNDPSTA